MRSLSSRAWTVLLLAALPPFALAHDDPDRQLQDISRQIETHPGDATLFLRRAELQRFRRDWSAGVADLQSARRLDADLAAVDLALAGLLHDADNPQAALPAVDAFLAARPDHSAAHLLRARILLKLGSRREAIREFTRGIDLERTADGVAPALQPDDYLDRARAVAAEGDTSFDEAIRGLDEGLLALGQPITLQLLAIELEEQRAHWDAALARLAALEARANRKETWIARRGDLLVRAGRPGEAARAYAAALAAIDALPDRLRSHRTVTELSASLRTRMAGLSSPATGQGTTNPSANFEISACTTSAALPSQRRLP